MSALLFFRLENASPLSSTWRPVTMKWVMVPRATARGDTFWYCRTARRSQEHCKIHPQKGASHIWVLDGNVGLKQFRFVRSALRGLTCRHGLVGERAIYETVYEKWMLYARVSHWCLRSSMRPFSCRAACTPGPSTYAPQCDEPRTSPACRDEKGSPTFFPS